MCKRTARIGRYRPILLQCLVCLLPLLCSTSTAFAEALPIDPGSWTLAILPDTQVYSEFYPQHYNAQTQWIADHAVSHNIQYVLHEGDVTEHNTVSEWNKALPAMNLLNGVVSYAISPGNHDYGPSGFSATRDSLFNDPAYFGPGSFYANQGTVGGFYEAGDYLGLSDYPNVMAWLDRCAERPASVVGINTPKRD